ncbi:MAG: hypothetical protein IT321_18700 [Anaerolineae bacterium]|nr:hypothetical protein [Anaerolineae bacterium]
MLHPNVMRYGIEAPLPESIALRAGPLSLIFDNGDLRYIRLGQREIIRRIYFAVRDPNWGTAANQLSNVVIESSADSFSITFQVDNRLGEIDFGWQGKMTGDSSGIVTFRFDGEARSTFRRNRLGFCVLHPIAECAGATCTLEHADGTIEEANFPQLVAPQTYVNGKPTPHAPFDNLRAMTYPVAPDVRAELRFEGDTFEMEDQRNWIDASFKTYCTPLALPFPVEVAAGTRIHQQLQLRLHGQPTIETHADEQPVTITTTNTPQYPLPPIGLSVASHQQPLTATEIERLKALHLSHLRVEIHFTHADWRERLGEAAAQADALDLPLELVLLLSDETERELRALAAVLAELNPRVAAYTLWHTRELVTSSDLARLARDVLGADVPIGIGTKANFAELNRAWPDVSAADFVSFTANPQVHAFDNASIAETPAALVAIIETALAHTGGKPIALSPLTLKQQFNPVAIGPEIAPPAGELPSKVDPRQLSLFAAGWTLACLKHLAESGRLHHVSLYETTGWLGVMEVETASQQSQKFPSLTGGVFPIYHALADLGDCVGAQVIPSISSEPLRVEALVLQTANQRRVLLANLTDEAQTVALDGWGGEATLWTLDERDYLQAALSPEEFRQHGGEPFNVHNLSLPPYALACIDYFFEEKNP